MNFQKKSWLFVTVSKGAMNRELFSCLLSCIKWNNNQCKINKRPAKPLLNNVLLITKYYTKKTKTIKKSKSDFKKYISLKESKKNKKLCYLFAIENKIIFASFFFQIFQINNQARTQKYKNLPREWQWAKVLLSPLWVALLLTVLHQTNQFLFSAS